MKRQIGTYYENNEADKMIFKVVRLEAELCLQFAKMLETCSDEDFNEKVLSGFKEAERLIDEISGLEDEIFAKKDSWKTVRHPTFIDFMKYSLDDNFARLRHYLSFVSVVDKRGDMARRYLERALKRDAVGTRWKYLNSAKCVQIEKMVKDFLNDRRNNVTS